MSTPKRHHTVPKFYLRRFAIGDKVELVHRDDLNKAPLTLTVENALVGRNFYTFPQEDGASDTSVESFLSEHIEGPGSVALERVIDKGRHIHAPGLRGRLAHLIAFQYVRGASARHMSVEQFKAVTQKTVLTMTPEMFRAELEKTGAQPTEEDIGELYEFAQDPGQYKIGVSSEASLHLGWALQAATALARAWYRTRIWQVAEFDEPLLITGDEPVALVGTSFEPGEFGGPLMAPIVAFPVDPHHAILLFQRDLVDQWGRVKGTKRMAHDINRHVAFGCHRFIVQRPGASIAQHLSLPEKAAATETIGDYVIYRRNLSVASAKRHAAAVMRDQKRK